MKHFRLLIFALTALFGLNAQAQEDITDTYLRNADLTSLDGWTHNGYTAWKTDGAVPVIEFWNWSSQFTFSQTITLPAGDYRLAVNSFYRESWTGNGTNNDMAWIFAGDKTQNVYALTNMTELSGYAGSNDLYHAATAFSLGEYSNEFDFSINSDNTEITIGFTGTTPNGGWCILGPVKLYKYSLENYLVDYRNKVAEAEALYDVPMNKDVLAALKAAVIDERNFRLGSEVATAIAALNEKITAANQSIQNYKDAKAVIDAAATLTANGQADYAASEIVQQIKAEYDARTLVSLTDEQKAAAKEALAAAVKKQTETGADYTPAAPTTWVGQTGGYQNRAERYSDASNFKYTGDVMTQTIEGVPAGAYKVVLEATASYTSGRGFTAKTGDDLAVIFANAQTTNLPVVDRTAINTVEEYGPIEVTGKVGADGVLKYGIQKLDEEGGNWFVVNVVSITKMEYVPATAINASDLDVEVTKTAPINAAIVPENATFKDITYTSNDETIATVDAEGVVTGVAIGSTTITIAADDITKVITVNVKAPVVLPTSITLDQTEIALDVIENLTATLAATVNPAEASQEVSFASDNEAVATVSPEGVITAAGIGSATITVTSKAAEAVKATATVTVTGAEVPANFAITIEDGKDYWFMNAATGKFLGGANSWGTRASLIKHGIPFKAVAVEGQENVYNLDSYTSNGGANHFLAGEWIDGGTTAITITACSNGAYNLKIGDNLLTAKTSNTEVDLKASDANDAFAQWYLISEEDWLSNFDNATEENPADATFLIKDYNFSRNNTQYANWNKTNVTNAQNGNGNGNHYNWNVESWHKLFSMNQQIVLPNGTYRLKAQGFYRQDGEDAENLAYFFANNEKQTFPEKTGAENSMDDAAASFSKGLYTIEPITVTVNDFLLNIGARNDVNTALWCIWDNFELECVDKADNQESVTVEIGETEHATLYYSYLNLQVPDGVQAFTVVPAGDHKVALVPIESGIIPAGEGVIVKGKKGSYQFKIADTDDIDTNPTELLGTDIDTYIAETGYKYYMLTTKDGIPSTLGFYYQSGDGSSINNAAHKCYLKIAAAEAPMAFTFVNPDGIQEVGTIENNSDVYTISGVRMNDKPAQKGIYIINGKKVVVK